MTGTRVGRVAFGLALANLGLMAVAAGVAAATRPGEMAREWREWTLYAMPTAWLAAGCWLARPGRRSARVAAGAAGVYLFLTYNLLEQVVEGAGWGVRGVLPRWAGNLAADFIWAPAAVTITALVPAAVGWWQRRGRRADPDDEG